MKKFMDLTDYRGSSCVQVHHVILMNTRTLWLKRDAYSLLSVLRKTAGIVILTLHKNLETPGTWEPECFPRFLNTYIKSKAFLF